MITGGYAYLKGVRNFQDSSVGILRRPFLKISWITTILIFVLATQLFGKIEGILSALLYSIIPTTIISSRLALMENGYIPLFLGSMIFAHLFLEKRLKKLWIIACILGFLGLLIKLWAGSIVLSLIFIALFFGKKDKKFMIVSAVTAGIAALVTFASVGLMYNWNMFLSVLKSNANRFYGASSEVVFQALTGSRITTSKYLTDGWIFAAWISFLALILNKTKKYSLILLISVFSYLAVFVFFGSESYGWYKYPFFPFLIIALSKILVDLFRKPNLLAAVILFSLPIGTAAHRLIGVSGMQGYIWLIRLAVAVSVALMVLWGVNKKWGVSLYRILFILAFSFAIYLSIKEIYFYTYETWFFVT